MKINHMFMKSELMMFGVESILSKMTKEEFIQSCLRRTTKKNKAKLRKNIEEFFREYGY